MTSKERNRPRPLGLKRYALLLAAAWTLAIGTSLTWRYFHERDAARQAAIVVAREQFSKDVIYRRWNTGHGGVYVPISESTPPNPYLAHVEERDIETPSGRWLTLINPAYMTRQVYELGFEIAGARGHITSLDPIRSANAPDTWERRALETFERGEQEFSSVEILDGEAYLRLMRPLMTEKGCLKCHAAQGYKEGDVRGGISVSIPMASYTAIARKDMTIIGVGHSALWLLGLAVLVFGTRHIQQRVGERDRAEEALRKSEEKHRTYIENAPDGIFVVDSNGRYVDVNQTACLMTGYSREELLSMSVSELASPESPSVFSELKETGRVQTDVILRRKNGTDFHSSLKAVALSDNSFMAFCSDITEREQAEDTLRESEERFRSLFETMVSGFSLLEMVYDEDGKPVDCRYVAANPAHQRHSGLNQSEIIGKGAKELFGLKDEWIEKYDHVAKTGEHIAIEDYVEGLGRWFSVVAYRPKPGFVAVTFQDITERKQAEEALRLQSEITVNMSEGVYLIGIDDLKIKYTNPKFAEMFGYGPDEMVGKDVSIVNAPSEITPRKTVDYIVGILKETGIWKGEIQNIKKDGTPFWCYASVSVFDHPDYGEIIISVHTDITERKRMEEELQKMEKLESVGILAGGIAHDLNNFLTGIVGNISLAMMYEDPREKDKRLAEAEKACMQIKDLTQQMLTFSKGGAPILQTAAIGDLLRDSASFTLRGSNVGCEFSIPDDLWPAEIDGGQINQVINNLVINARQAMPTGGMVKICAENATIGPESGLLLEPGAYIKISVEDQGIGIPQDHLQKIFDPFFTTKQAGNGLGLATSYSIIGKHKGHIAVESQIGVGTTFHIYLPASPEGVLMDEKEMEKRPIMGVGRVLVMDDEKHVRDTAASMLSSIGYEAITAIDGAEAIEIYKEAMSSASPFDAVIMDLTIPGGMGGEETIQRLMEIDPEVKAIVSSGYSNDPILANFREYGFMGFIAKPYKIQELSEILHGVITGAD